VFYPDVRSAENAAPYELLKTCPRCGQPSFGPTIAVDMHMPTRFIMRVLFHRDCAMRMSLDVLEASLPNRHTPQGLPF
jgi:hypothetical protein